jgi:hypothetical protein
LNKLISPPFSHQNSLSGLNLDNVRDNGDNNLQGVGSEVEISTPLKKQRISTKIKSTSSSTPITKWFRPTPSLDLDKDSETIVSLIDDDMLLVNPMNSIDDQTPITNTHPGNNYATKRSLPFDLISVGNYSTVNNHSAFGDSKPHSNPLTLHHLFQLPPYSSLLKSERSSFPSFTYGTNNGSKKPQKIKFNNFSHVGDFSSVSSHTKLLMGSFNKFFALLLDLYDEGCMKDHQEGV